MQVKSDMVQEEFFPSLSIASVQDSHGHTQYKASPIVHLSPCTLSTLTCTQVIENDKNTSSK